MTTVSHRLAPSLVAINGEQCKRCIARKPTQCAHSGKPINPGDKVYRPMGHTVNRNKRYLALEIDSIDETLIGTPP